MYPEAERITLVQDNLSAHKPSALYELHEPERARAIVRRLEVVPTPKHGSWLNVAEIELSVLSRQGLSERIPDREMLTREAVAWARVRTGEQRGVDWQFTTAEARALLGRSPLMGSVTFWAARQGFCRVIDCRRRPVSPPRGSGRPSFTAWRLRLCGAGTAVPPPRSPRAR
jgi:hypothetical protein